MIKQLFLNLMIILGISSIVLILVMFMLLAVHMFFIILEDILGSASNAIWTLFVLFAIIVLIVTYVMTQIKVNNDEDEESGRV